MKFTKIIFVLVSLIFCGCVDKQEVSSNINKQSKEWNSLFDSSDWQPVNNEKTIENFNKKAM